MRNKSREKVKVRKWLPSSVSVGYAFKNKKRYNRKKKHNSGLTNDL